MKTFNSNINERLDEVYQESSEDVTPKTNPGGVYDVGGLEKFEKETNRFWYLNFIIK